MTFTFSNTLGLALDIYIKSIFCIIHYLPTLVNRFFYFPFCVVFYAFTLGGRGTALRWMRGQPFNTSPSSVENDSFPRGGSHKIIFPRFVILRLFSPCCHPEECRWHDVRISFPSSEDFRPHLPPKLNGGRHTNPIKNGRH